MELQRLHLLHYRNHEALTLEFCSGINGISGPNGAGKTGILDAVHYLANCKSYFNGLDAPLMRHGSDFFTLRGIFSAEGKVEEIVIHVPAQGKKNVKRNGKAYERLMDHIGLLQTVMIAPNDVELVWGSSEERRRFIDLTLSQTDRFYLESLVGFRQSLDQRNALLKALKGKQADPILFEAIEHRFVPSGNEVHRIRRNFFHEFTPLFEAAYAGISGGTERAGLEYKSDLEHHSLQQLLNENRQKDCVLERTSRGPHRDDVVFTLNGYPLKRYGSQGQIKSFVLALKVAQYRYFFAKKRQKPILLLDDIFEKIDEERAESLMKLVSSEDFGQIIISDTHPERVRAQMGNLDIESRFYTLDKEGYLIT